MKRKLKKIILCLVVSVAIIGVMSTCVLAASDAYPNKTQYFSGTTNNEDVSYTILTEAEMQTIREEYVAYDPYQLWIYSFGGLSATSNALYNFTVTFETDNGLQRLIAEIAYNRVRLLYGRRPSTSEAWTDQVMQNVLLEYNQSIDAICFTPCLTYDNRGGVNDLVSYVSLDIVTDFRSHPARIAPVYSVTLQEYTTDPQINSNLSISVNTDGNYNFYVFDGGMLGNLEHTEFARWTTAIELGYQGKINELLSKLQDESYNKQSLQTEIERLNRLINNINNTPSTVVGTLFDGIGKMFKTPMESIFELSFGGVSVGQTVAVALIGLIVFTVVKWVRG